MATGVSTRDPLIITPYLDPDVGRYNETPRSKELMIRVAASPAGSGALVSRRQSVATTSYPGAAGVRYNERVGRTLDPASGVGSWTASGGSSAVAAYSATAPAGYAGASSLEIQATGGLTTERGGGLTLPMDLSQYGGGTHLRVWRRGTSVTNLGRWWLQLSSVGGAWVRYTLMLPADAINTWAEVVVALDQPYATSGTFDWSQIAFALIYASPTAAYTGNLQVRDLRLGAVQTGGSPVTGHLAWEATYDIRARYRDDAAVKVANTTLAAASAVGATNVKLAAVAGLAVGDELTLWTNGFVETRAITAVGTAGSGGTGVTVAEAYAYAHPSGDLVETRYWGPWSSWLTVKTTQPPVVAPSSPANAAVVTDPTLSLVHTYSSPSGKAQAGRVTNVYERVGGVDQLIYSMSASGTGLTDTLPRFLLYRTAPVTFAWDKDVYDADNVPTTTARRTFTTAFVKPIPVVGLVGVADPSTGTVTLSWTAYAGADFDHYRVYWRDGSGNRVRLDGGPETLDDGKPPLILPTFIHAGGARLGDNDYEVTVHTGALESDSAFVTVHLGAMRAGSWQFVTEGDGQHSFAFDASSVSRSPNANIATLRPPGRGSPIHIDLGLGGDHVSLTLSYIPAEDGDLARRIKEMLRDRLRTWVIAPDGYLWDVMRCRVVDMNDSPAPYGFANINVELDEVAS